MQSLTTQSFQMPSADAVRPVKPLGRLGRAGLVLGMCAVLALGIFAGPHASTSHHSVSSVATHMVATTPDITGGPGSV